MATQAQLDALCNSLPQGASTTQAMSVCLNAYVQTVVDLMVILQAAITATPPDATIITAANNLDANNVILRANIAAITAAATSDEPNRLLKRLP